MFFTIQTLIAHQKKFIVYHTLFPLIKYLGYMSQTKCIQA